MLLLLLLPPPLLPPPPPLLYGPPPGRMPAWTEGDAGGVCAVGVKPVSRILRPDAPNDGRDAVNVAYTPCVVCRSTTKPRMTGAAVEAEPRAMFPNASSMLSWLLAVYGNAPLLAGAALYGSNL